MIKKKCIMDVNKSYNFENNLVYFLFEKSVLSHFYIKIYFNFNYLQNKDKLIDLVKKNKLSSFYYLPTTNWNDKNCLIIITTKKNFSYFSEFPCLFKTKEIIDIIYNFNSFDFSKSLMFQELFWNDQNNVCDLLDFVENSFSTGLPDSFCNFIDSDIQKNEFFDKNFLKLSDLSKEERVRFSFELFKSINDC